VVSVSRSRAARLGRTAGTSRPWHADDQDRIHQRSFSTAGATSGHYDSVRQHPFQRLALAGTSDLARPPLAPCDRLFEINRRVTVAVLASRLILAAMPSSPPEMRQEDQGSPSISSSNSEPL